MRLRLECTDPTDGGFIYNACYDREAMIAGSSPALEQLLAALPVMNVGCGQSLDRRIEADFTEVGGQN